MEQYQSVTSHIVDSVNTLESLVKDTQDAESGNDRMLAELALLRARIAEFSDCKTDLSGRSKAMREKIDDFSEDMKRDSDEVKAQIKKYFKSLGVEVEQAPLNGSENYIEVRISLKKTARATFSLAYDPVSQDFELISMNPEHPRFDDLRNLLAHNRDIPGFIAMFRKFHNSRQ